MTVGTVCAACGQDTHRRHHGCTRCAQCGGLKSASALRCYACAWPGRQPRATRPVAALDEPAPTSPPLIRRVRLAFRVYCFACGRATDVEVAPPTLGRCQACGGSLLVEVRD